MSERQDKIDQAIADRVGIGHNLPSEEQAIRDNMAELYRSYQPRVDELLKDGAAIPESIPEAMIPTVTDYIGALTTHVRKVDSSRKSEKDKYTRAGQVVDGFFKRMVEPLEDFKVKIQKRLKAALDAKADRERREQEEAARKEREAAEARKRAADELLRQEQERAAAAKREAEAAEARRLEQQRILQEEIRRDEERKRAAIEQAERDRAAAEELARQNCVPVTGSEPQTPNGTDPMNTAATGEPATESSKSVPSPATPAPLSLAERLAVEERERLAGLAAKRTAVASDNAQRDLAEATREADRATNRATAATMQHAKVIAAPSADFARTRGDYGKVATLQDFWDVSPVDRDQLDKRAIWKFITNEALDQAVRAYRDSFAGQEPKPLRGVTFFKNTRGQVR